MQCEGNRNGTSFGKLEYEDWEIGRDETRWQVGVFSGEETAKEPDIGVPSD